MAFGAISAPAAAPAGAGATSGTPIAPKPLFHSGPSPSDALARARSRGSPSLRSARDGDGPRELIKLDVGGAGNFNAPAQICFANL